MKRVIAMLLCVVLLLAALPGSVSAAKVTREESVTQEIRRIYEKCLELSGKESFEGLCGMMTSLQLWQMGINSEHFGTNDGKMQYDMYCGMRVTSGGYHITAYPAADYTLLQALNEITRNGTRDASNILVGFESTTTEAGSVYGHACVIHKIINGRVYFLENYTSFSGPEGTVNSCTIAQFADYYSDWTVLDGVIHFGDSLYADGCKTFSTDIYVRTRFDSTLRSEPCLLGENYCIRLRTLMAGEMLHATAVLKNDRDDLYYRVDDGDRVGYVAANAVSVIQVDGDALAAEEIRIPSVIGSGEALQITGAVSAENCSVSAMRVELLDKAGNRVHEAKLELSGVSCNLNQLNEQLDLSKLPMGIYDVKVYVTAACVAVKGNGLVTVNAEQLVARRELTVGHEFHSRSITPKEPEQIKDGWFCENGIWYYYKYQKPCTGWITYLGVDYYLKEDGSVTTGWAEIEGWSRYFTGTGALCLGWLKTPAGLRYWLPDGTEAVGLQKIKGKYYYFQEDFLMATEGTVTVDGVTYQIQKDGVALEVTE